MRRHYQDLFGDFREEMNEFLHDTHQLYKEEEDDDLQLALELSKMDSNPSDNLNYDNTDLDDEELLRIALEESKLAQEIKNQDRINIPIEDVSNNNVYDVDEDEELKLAIEMSLAEKEEREGSKNNNIFVDDEPIDPNILQRIEFEETVQKDLEREKMRQEEREFQHLVEMNEKLEKEMIEKNREFRISELKEKLGPEPSKNEENTTTLKFRLFNNDILTRRFKKTDKVQLLYDYIELYLYENNLFDRKISIYINTLPKKILNDMDQTIQEADVIGSLIYVEEE